MPGWSVAGFELGEIYEKEIFSIPNARFYSGDLAKVTERFDLITLSHVAEHLLKPGEVFRQAASLLAPSGHIVVRVPCFRQVYTDFFILEHCSHFVPETLKYALNQAQLKVTHALEGLSAIEIGFIAMVGDEKPIAADCEVLRRDALEAIQWSLKLLTFVRDNAQNKKIGLFGVGGAGVWLGTALRGVVDFYVDEDPGKQGQSFAGVPILHPDSVPSDGRLFVTFNTPQSAYQIGKRLSEKYRSLEILVSPK